MFRRLGKEDKGVTRMTGITGVGSRSPGKFYRGVPTEGRNT